jgi:hypothetical protein
MPNENFAKHSSSSRFPKLPEVIERCRAVNTPQIRPSKNERPHLAQTPPIEAAGTRLGHSVETLTSPYVKWAAGQNALSKETLDGPCAFDGQE